MNLTHRGIFMHLFIYKEKDNSQDKKNRKLYLHLYRKPKKGKENIYGQPYCVYTCVCVCPHGLLRN